MYNKKTKSFSLNLHFLLKLTKKRVHKLHKRQNNKPVNLSLIKTFVTKKLFGEHKHIVNDPYRLFKILLVYSYDYIKLAGALIYHFDIYIGRQKYVWRFLFSRAYFFPPPRPAPYCLLPRYD